jgi:uncharacterized Zn finger protein
LSRVVIDGRAIANTFWGQAWCTNLERYSDYSNRLARGRTYARNGSIVDLQIESGRVTALVSGSEVYNVDVNVTPISEAQWAAVCTDCAGTIDSVVELLEGRLSKAVMARVCEKKTGLFPTPAEIKFSCDCPDFASMCKHIAAVLYGIGARLDQKPELLFNLRMVDQRDLIAKAGEGMIQARKKPTAAKRLKATNLSDLFGIEVDDEPVKSRKPVKRQR